MWKSYRIVLRKVDPFPHLMYARKRGFIFIHIPKTAGTSVLNALDIQFRHHFDWSVFEAADPALFRRCYKFCFVRNPYDRAVSVYTYIKGGGAGGVDEEFARLVNDKYKTFGSFVNEYLSEDVIHEHPLLRPQYLFVHGFSGARKVDFVGRFENLEEDFAVVCRKLSIPSKLQKVNASKRNEYPLYYTPEIKKRIFALYRKDFEYFSYPVDF